MGLLAVKSGRRVIEGRGIRGFRQCIQIARVALLKSISVDIFARHNVNGVLEAGLNVLPFKRRIIVPDDCLWRNGIADQFQNGVDRNPSPCDAGFSEMDFRAHLDSTHSVNIDPGVQEFNIHHDRWASKMFVLEWALRHTVIKDFNNS